METITKRLSDELSDTTYGLYALLIGAMGAFIASSLSCETQYTLVNNMYIKNLLILVVIFIGVNAASAENLHPANALIKSFLVWLLFVGFNRMRPFNTSIAIILIIMLFVVRSYKDYLEKELNDSHVPDDKISKESNKIGNAEMVILLGLIANIIIGAYVYWDDHKPKDADAFDFAKFMMGTPDCKKDNLKFSN